jgi:hypothetical protein
MTPSVAAGWSEWAGADELMAEWAAAPSGPAAGSAGCEGLAWVGVIAAHAELGAVLEYTSYPTTPAATITTATTAAILVELFTTPPFSPARRSSRQLALPEVRQGAMGAP